MHVVCAWFTRGIHVLSTWYACGMHVVCMLYVCGMHGICTWYARGMHAVYTWSARGTHVVCTCCAHTLNIPRRTFAKRARASVKLPFWCGNPNTNTTCRDPPNECDNLMATVAFGDVVPADVQKWPPRRGPAKVFENRNFCMSSSVFEREIFEIDKNTYFCRF